MALYQWYTILVSRLNTVRWIQKLQEGLLIFCYAEAAHRA